VGDNRGRKSLGRDNKGGIVYGGTKDRGKNREYLIERGIIKKSANKGPIEEG
jgi:hypothetical protein